MTILTRCKALQPELEDNLSRAIAGLGCLTPASNFSRKREKLATAAVLWPRLPCLVRVELWELKSTS